MSAVHDKIIGLISGIVPRDTDDCVSHAINGCPLSATLDMKTGPLRSEHTCTCFYKRGFNYGEPMTISLNISAANEEFKAFHYIPVT
jgi:hypothetical protein